MSATNTATENADLREIAEAELIAEQVRNHEQIFELMHELNGLNPIDTEYSDLAHRISLLKQTTDLYLTMVQSKEVLSFDQTELNFGEGVQHLAMGGYFSDTGVKVINASQVEDIFPAVSSLTLTERVKYCLSRGYLIWGTSACQKEISLLASNSEALWQNKISERVKVNLKNK